MKLQTFDGITYRYRHDPVPYCGEYRRRKPIPPYNKRTSFLNFIQEEEYRYRLPDHLFLYYPYAHHTVRQGPYRAACLPPKRYRIKLRVPLDVRIRLGAPLQLYKPQDVRQR